MKTKKLSALELKLDLMKEYDRVSWNFLILVILQIGLNLEITRWILGCVYLANFVVLINEGPTNFFKASRGIR